MAPELLVLALPVQCLSIQLYTSGLQLREDLADGFPMDDAELDGEPLDLSTPGWPFLDLET